MRIVASVRRDFETLGAAGFALGLLFLGVVISRYRFDFAPLRPQAEHFTLAFALLVLAFLLFQKRARLVFQPSDVLLGAYLALALMSSILFPEQPRASVQYWLRMATSVAVYFLVRWLLTATDVRTAFRLAVKALLIFGVLEALFGIVSWFLYPFGVNLGVDEYPLGIRGPGGIVCNFSLTMYGTLWEPNAFGGALMTVILIGATLFVSNEFAVWRKALGSALVVMLMALALNGSRAALATLVFGLALIVLFAQGMGLREKLKWGAAALAVIVVVAVPSLEIARGLMQMPSAPGFAARAPCAAWIAQGMPLTVSPGAPEYSDPTGPGSDISVVNRFMEGQTLTSRWVSYKYAWDEFLQRPLFGNGADSFGQRFTTTAHTPGWISNMLLMSLHDTGIVGTLLLSTWLLWYARQIFGAWRRAHASALRVMVFALGVGLIALLITYQATTMMWFGLVWWYFAMLEQGAHFTKA